MRHDGLVRRILLILSTALVTAAAVVLLDAALTLAWKEPASAIYASFEQDEAADELERVDEEFLAGLPAADLPGRACLLYTSDAADE